MMLRLLGLEFDPNVTGYLFGRRQIESHRSSKPEIKGSDIRTNKICESKFKYRSLIFESCRKDFVIR
jgi:hypothetical protein